jgi:hypothetical protein
MTTSEAILLVAASLFLTACLTLVAVAVQYGEPWLIAPIILCGGYGLAFTYLSDIVRRRQ